MASMCAFVAALGPRWPRPFWPRPRAALERFRARPLASQLDQPVFSGKSLLFLVWSPSDARARAASSGGETLGPQVAHDIHNHEGGWRECTRLADLNRQSAIALCICQLLSPSSLGVLASPTERGGWGCLSDATGLLARPLRLERGPAARRRGRPCHRRRRGVDDDGAAGASSWPAARLDGSPNDQTLARWKPSDEIGRPNLVPICSGRAAHEP